MALFREAPLYAFDAVPTHREVVVGGVGVAAPSTRTFTGRGEFSHSHSFQHYPRRILHWYVGAGARARETLGARRCEGGCRGGLASCEGAQWAAARGLTARRWGWDGGDMACGCSRAQQDVLDLVDVCLDTNYVHNTVRIRLPGDIVPDLTVLEVGGRQAAVVIWVATASSSLHRLVLPHPTAVDKVRRSPQAGGVQANGVVVESSG